MNFDNLKIAFQYALPKHGVSKLVGYLAKAKLGFFSTWLIKGFIKAYDINMSEAKLKNAVFGELNRYEWYLMERKHLNHHFEQFNLL